MLTKGTDARPRLLMESLNRAQKHWQALEGEMEELVSCVEPHLRKWHQQAKKAQWSVRKQLNALQNRVIGASGLATQAQLKALKAELARVQRKVNAVVGKGG